MLITFIPWAAARAPDEIFQQPRSSPALARHGVNRRPNTTIRRAEVVDGEIPVALANEPHCAKRWKLPALSSSRITVAERESASVSRGC
jgi:hypothetical protein